MALFEGMGRRVAERAQAVASDAVDRIERAFAQMPDVKLRREDDMLRIEAKGLLRRWMGDVRLRFAWWWHR